MMKKPQEPAGADVVRAIRATACDYYEGWFEGDAERMRRALHPELVKRAIADSMSGIETDTQSSMVEATQNGVGTRYPPERRNIDISINHVHDGIADVHVTGDVYVDYLQMVNIDGRWQILNALWAPARAQ
jgi:Putative lumazine-binding